MDILSILKKDHQDVDALFKQVEASEPWDAKLKVLIDLVRHHVREEEREFFKSLKSQLSSEELRELGENILAFKQSFKAPSPSSPRAAQLNGAAAERARPRDLESAAAS